MFLLQLSLQVGQFTLWSRRTSWEGPRRQRQWNRPRSGSGWVSVGKKYNWVNWVVWQKTPQVEKQNPATEVREATTGQRTRWLFLSLAHLGGSDLLHVQSVIQQLCGGEMLLHKVLQDLNPHVWVVDLKIDTAALHKTSTKLSHTHTTCFSVQLQKFPNI